MYEYFIHSRLFFVMFLILCKPHAHPSPVHLAASQATMSTGADETKIPDLTGPEHHHAVDESRGVLDADIEYRLCTHDEIQSRLTQLGAQISRDYENKNPLLVGVLTGAIMMVADLARKITIPCELDFLAASSYVTRHG